MMEVNRFWRGWWITNILIVIICMMSILAVDAHPQCDTPAFFPKVHRRGPLFQPSHNDRFSRLRKRDVKQDSTGTLMEPIETSNGQNRFKIRKGPAQHQEKKRPNLIKLKS